MARRVPADLEDALAASPAARDRFWSLPPEQKDAWVAYVLRGRLPRARRRRAWQAARRLGGPEVVHEERAAGVAAPRQEWPLVLLAVAALAGLAAFLLWLTVFRHHGGSSRSAAAVVVASKTDVPKVTGIRYQAARFQLEQAKLATKITRRNAGKPKGIVVGQAPQAGKTVAQGTPVTLVVSKGPPGVAMPDVVGLAAADAVRALQQRRLRPTLVQTASREAPGTVLAQQPKAGKRAKPGTKVVLHVAKGAAAVAVPDVTGQTQGDAVAALKSAGFTSRVIQVSSSQPPATVVAQSPAAGRKLGRGTTVRLNVAKGGPATTASTTTATTTATTTTATTTSAAPANGNDYTGMRLSAAVQRIVQGRQQVIVQYVSSSKPAGVVVANAPAGSRERLQVSTGPSPKPAAAVPDVTGEDAASAQSDLQAAGFSVVQVSWPVSDQSNDGVVVAETPAAGAQVPQGAAVVVYVGSASG